ncbi:MAG: hypothetical protein A2039_08960 [Candidatus Melainabacteria bacterium GWA2_34_9]|nr:MAG: hypothetical protein A2039_08960 [Candidatus Melainabacteria bacterium GWA2_34_9]
MPILPEKLKKGDTIGIISPAGAVKDQNLWNTTIEYFENKGYKIKIATHANDKNTYLAGKDETRLSDLIDFFKDEEIKAIICSRGGYGTFRLLEKIDWEIIKQNPKIFVGYSDITALLNNFVEKSGMIAFHGPLALSDFGVEQINKYTEESFWRILEGKAEIPYSFQNPLNYKCILPGKTQGVLMGGNLAVLCGLLGTPYFPDLSGKILLLEDVGEPLYKIDRMLMQLKLAGVFEKVSGILFGEFTAIIEAETPDVNKLTPVDIIKELAKELNIPIGYGFTASHSSHKATLPLGIKYNFESTDFKFEIIENYVF